MSEHNITVESGASVRLPTAGKYCDRDIVVTATGGAFAEDDLIENKRTSYTNDRVTKIAGNVFQNNTYLIEVSFSNAISVGGNAFNNCTALTTVNLPSATSLESSAFYQCKKVVNFNAPNLTSIGSNALRYCPLSAVMKFPKLTSLSGYAFQGCTNVEYFDVNKVTTITTYTFYGCTKLRTLVLRRSDKPVTLASPTNAFTNTPISNGEGFIYVPRDLVDSYKANTNWKNFANQILAIEDYPEIIQ